MDHADVHQQSHCAQLERPSASKKGKVRRMLTLCTQNRNDGGQVNKRFLGDGIVHFVIEILKLWSG